MRIKIQNPQTRLAIGTCSIYVIILLVVIGYGSIAFHDLYALKTETQQHGTYHQFLRLSGFGLAFYLGIWTAAFGVWRRSYWQGLVALVFGAIMTILALSALPWMYFPSDQYPPSALWVFGAGLPTIITWILVTILARIFTQRRGATNATPSSN